ncbi:MAG: peptidylprolyl isomerase [Bacteroidetes bacterium]|nr:peptidylprolyl isomerase [Bacteroidota bacterium]
MKSCDFAPAFKQQQSQSPSPAHVLVLELVLEHVLVLVLILLPIITFSQRDSATVRAPEVFHAEFETTKGNFTIEVNRDWSPNGADRLFQLIASGFFNNNSIFRVQPGYVIQFGISDSKEVNRFWDKRAIDDEPLKESNVKGTVSFAHGGPKTRTTQLFINLNDNKKLDTIVFQGIRGFPPVGKVVSGMGVIESFYSGYGFDPAEDQDTIMVQGNAFLKKKYPELDYILRVKFVGGEK